ncbi:helix-turn-helix domain-containing protein [Pseudoduganella eburnea]|uniref:Helix-turn-helix domain-containing protein n=1 Tax=Massilia eburnea TaxID=1776165 RepID=A0A6L6QIX8_9BURK|nr:helix-turn-helix domain-containing protein [Massilia eburnea]MTW12428.1 helix-turn-helix domain-containing protein [Massilia eburnea]
MRYQEFPPPPGLAGLVDCLWLSEAPAAPSPAAPLSKRVLPDNCTDILWQDSGEAFFVGMMSTWFDVPAARPVRTVAVRFRPGAASLFLGPVPLAGLTDERADLDLLWGRATADRLGDALWSVARSDAERLALLTEALYARLALAAPGARAATALASRVGRDVATAAARLAAAAPAGQLLALRAVAELEASGGALRVATLADTLGVSRQYLATQFRNHVGLSPKLFARICRFRSARAAALAAATAAPASHGHDWATLALDSGYFDQSHLIRDFQDFTGASPDAHLGSR